MKLDLYSITNGHVLSNIQVGETLTYKFDSTSNLTTANLKIVPSISGALY